MTMLDVVPQEFFDAVAVPPAVTLDGELLAALDEAPAGPWDARDAQRRHARLASLGSLVLRTRIHSLHADSHTDAELASRPDAIGADKDIAFANRRSTATCQTLTAL